jgi:hypothetical protein
MHIMPENWLGNMSAACISQEIDFTMSDDTSLESAHTSLQRLLVEITPLSIGIDITPPFSEASHSTQ